METQNIKIEYRYMGDVLKTQIEPYINKWKWFIPSWVRTLYIDEVRRDDFYGQISLYRTKGLVIMDISVSILEKDLDIEEIILHEICHCHTNPVWEVALEAIKDLPEEKITEKWLRQTLEIQTDALCSTLLEKERNK